MLLVEGGKRRRGKKRGKHERARNILKMQDDSVPKQPRPEKSSEQDKVQEQVGSETNSARTRNFPVRESTTARQHISRSVARRRLINLCCPQCGVQHPISEDTNKCETCGKEWNLELLDRMFPEDEEITA